MPRLLTTSELEAFDHTTSLVFQCQPPPPPPPPVEGAPPPRLPLPPHHVAADRAALLALSNVLADVLSEGGAADEAVPLPASPAAALALCRYCEHRARHRDEAPYAGVAADAPAMRRPVVQLFPEVLENAYDRAFVTDAAEGLVPDGDVSRLGLLLEVLRLADFLHVEWLKDLCVCVVAALVRSRSVDGVREELFGLPSSSEADLQRYGEGYAWVDQQYSLGALVERHRRRWGSDEATQK